MASRVRDVIDTGPRFTQADAIRLNNLFRGSDAAEMLAAVIADKMVGEDIHEVALKIDIKATAAEGTAFQAELLYAGLFALKNLPADQLQPFLLAEAPRLLFPFARRVIADASTDAGFPPLMLDPIDFASLYMQQQGQLMSGAPAGQA